MRVIICSHEADIDGVYSASVALMKFPRANLSFYNYGLDNFKKMFDFIKNESKKSTTGLVIISDLGVNDEKVSSLCVDSIQHLKKRKWSVIWVDHHPWQKKSMMSIRKLCKLFHNSSGKKCATEIMYEKLVYKNKIAKQLKLMAHSSDFMTNIKSHDSRVSELIHFYRNSVNSRQKLEFLVHKASKGILWDSDMQKDYLKFLKVADFQKRESLKTLTIKKILSFDVAFVFTYPYVQASLFSHELFSNLKVDLVMLINRLGKVSIRRNSDRLSCSKIAAYLVEGGGHEFASGGMLKSNPKDFIACMKEMEEAVVKSLK
jgi:oligoribonuclease NrnB/cAMP/cGMP phosphodiesterase (DHH superfamily)